MIKLKEIINIVSSASWQIEDRDCNFIVSSDSELKYILKLIPIIESDAHVISISQSINYEFVIVLDILCES